MGTRVHIDNIDQKILNILIKDARTRLKDIAKECNLSSVSVLNRIKRMKTQGLITGAALSPNLFALGLQIAATIGMETDSHEEEIIKFIDENTKLIEPSTSFGTYDLTAFVLAENLAALDKVVFEIRRRFGVRKVTVNVWSGQPHLAYENIDLQPTECNKNGQT